MFIAQDVRPFVGEIRRPIACGFSCVYPMKLAISVHGWVRGLPVPDDTLGGVIHLDGYGQ